MMMAMATATALLAAAMRATGDDGRRWATIMTMAMQRAMARRNTMTTMMATDHDDDDDEVDDDTGSNKKNTEY